MADEGGTRLGARHEVAAVQAAGKRVLLDGGGAAVAAALDVAAHHRGPLQRLGKRIALQKQRGRSDTN